MTKTMTRTFALTIAAAAVFAAPGFARDDGERAPASEPTIAAAESAGPSGRNDAPRGATTEAILAPISGFLADVMSVSGRNDCVRHNCDAPVE